MIPVAFEYKKVNTVDEALNALLSSDGKILAGGHSLLPAMKLRLNQPAKLVDISRIDSLKGIKEEDGEIVIGAAATHAGPRLTRRHDGCVRCRSGRVGPGGCGGGQALTRVVAPQLTYTAHTVSWLKTDHAHHDGHTISASLS